MERKARPSIALLLVLVVTLAGCSALTGEGAIEATASKATVTDAALSETGYTEVDVRSYTLNRTITIGNESRQLNVTNYIAGYRKNYSSGLPAGFGVLSTPKVEILGQGINPLGHLGKKALMKQLLSRVEHVKDLQQTGTRTVTMLGNETEMTVFSGTASYGGRTVNVTAYFVRVEHGGDYVVAGGAHPASLESGASDIRRLVEGITHDAG